MDPESERTPTGAISDPRILRVARNLRAFHVSLETGLGLVVVGSVLAFGSVHPWAYQPLWQASGVLGLVLLAYLATGRALKRAIGPRKVSFHPTGRWLVLDESVPYTRPSWSVDLARPFLGRAPLLLPGLALLAWVSLQMVLLPTTLVRLLRPGRELPTAGWIPLSVEPMDTARGVAFLVSVLVLHAVAGTVFRSRNTRRRFTLLIVVLGLSLSVLALVQLATGTRRVYGFFKPLESDGELLFGPFVNRNNFAGYMLLVVFVSLAFLARHYRRYSERVGQRTNARRRLVGLASPEGTTLVFALVPVIIGTAALLATGSRGAALAFLAGLVVAVATRQRRGVWGVLVLVVFGLLWFPLDKLQRRFSQASVESVGRTAVWRDNLSRMDGFWLIGSGFNTYGTAMSRTTAFSLPRGATPWRDPVETSVVSAPNMGFRVVQAIGGLTWYREAHNDYLQLLVETGVPGLAIVLAGFVFLFRAVRRDPWFLAAVTALLLHEIVDFPLQIPAIAVLFVVVAALAASKTANQPPARSGGE